MRLQPKRPPGRADRKAGAYAGEIVRLRAEGYTYPAIREALAEVGILLSESTLRREVRRPQRRPFSVNSAQSTAPVPAFAQPPKPDAGGIKPLRQAVPHGREVAEAFFSAHPSNPLLPKEAP